jgi:hypothetical protein
LLQHFPLWLVWPLVRLLVVRLLFLWLRLWVLQRVRVLKVFKGAQPKTS